LYLIHLSPVAQSVERVAVNHLVGSSSLSRGARLYRRPIFQWAFFCGDPKDKPQIWERERMDQTKLSVSPAYGEIGFSSFGIGLLSFLRCNTMPV
jgi:hypothetical protein